MRLQICGKATFDRRAAGRFALLLAFAWWQAACGATAYTPPPRPPSTEPPRDSPRILNKKYLQKLPPGFQVPADNDDLAWLMLAEYGAVYVAQGNVVQPQTARFNNEEEVKQWQDTLRVERLDYGEEKYGNYVELQTEAMNAFKAAREEIEEMGLSLTPRGADAGRRSFADTVKLWQDRVNPGLDHWVLLKRLNPREAERIKALPATGQVAEILKLEAQGMYFSKDFTKTILASVAPPGASQHISLLALDVYEYENYDVRLKMAKHGWYQTIPYDLPHFTYLGVKESKLPELGLKRVINEQRAFWMPDVK
jgi:hypothetical protein